ncbi:MULTISPECIES: hypothetical protein [Clostridium]|nr:MULTISPECIES: hypothetical protein [Clostridium]
MLMIRCTIVRIINHPATGEPGYEVILLDEANHITNYHLIYI